MPSIPSSLLAMRWQFKHLGEAVSQALANRKGCGQPHHRSFAHESRTQRSRRRAVSQQQPRPGQFADEPTFFHVASVPASPAARTSPLSANCWRRRRTLPAALLCEPSRNGDQTCVRPGKQGDDERFRRVQRGRRWLLSHTVLLPEIFPVLLQKESVRVSPFPRPSLPFNRPEVPFFQRWGCRGGRQSPSPLALPCGIEGRHASGIPARQQVTQAGH